MSDPRVDAYIETQPQWRDGLIRMRGLLLETELEETIKWNRPYYVIGSLRAVGMSGFKSWIGLWFERGYAINDVHGVLHNAQPGKTKWQRNWHVTDHEQVSDEQFRHYFAEAVRVTKEVMK